MSRVLIAQASSTAGYCREALPRQTSQRQNPCISFERLIQRWMSGHLFDDLAHVIVCLNLAFPLLYQRKGPGH